MAEGTADVSDLDTLAVWIAMSTLPLYLSEDECCAGCPRTRGSAMRPPCVRRRSVDVGRSLDRRQPPRLVDERVIGGFGAVGIDLVLELGVVVHAGLALAR